MFKPTVTFSEIQKRKKMIIGMHLMELSDRYRFFSIVGSGRSQNYKTTSNSQNKKQHFFTQKHSTTLPVTPTSKSPSFLESSRLLVLKIKQLKPKALMRIRQQKTQTIDKNFNESFRQKESPDNPQQKKLKYSLKNQQSEISYSSDHDDFIDYVCNKKLI